MADWVSVHSESDNGSKNTPAIPSRSSSAKWLPPHRRGPQQAMPNVTVNVGDPSPPKEDDPDKGVFKPTSRLPLPYFLRKHELSLLRERFPRTLFECTSDTAHDHPVAHTENILSTRFAQRKMKAGTRILDVYGSPHNADAYNKSQAKAHAPRTMISMVCRKTEKDYLRSLKWGPADHADGTPRYLECTLEELLDEAEEDPAAMAFLRSFEVFYFGQTLYYVQRQTIARLVRLCPEAQIIATIHRHPHGEGTLFGGEVSYSKKGDKDNAIVTQVNVQTGESYVHSDLSWLWNSSTKVWREGDDAFTWTFHKVSDDTWVIEAGFCPSNLDERFENRKKSIGRFAAAFELNKQSLQQPLVTGYSLPGATSRLIGGIPVVTFNDSETELRITNPRLLEYLKGVQAGKPRDATRLMELYSVARTQIANGQQHPGKLGFQCEADRVRDHVALAFVAGLESEVEVLRGIRLMSVQAEEHRHLTNGTGFHVSGRESAGVTALKIARQANAVARSGDKVGSLLDTLLSVDSK